MRRVLCGLTVMLTVSVGCSSSETTPPPTGGEVNPSTSTVPSTDTATITIPIEPTLTLRAEEAPEFTEFTSSTECDRSADDANLQVIQAFITAYNARDETRLAELVPADPTIVADMSGIPHLGEDDWTDISRWAARGWSVNDQFQLTRLVMYGGGSVFELDRTNDVLRANGIEKLHHLGKVHSFGCAISQMVLYLPTSDDPSSPECLYWTVFDTALVEGTTQDIETPRACG